MLLRSITKQASDQNINSVITREVRPRQSVEFTVLPKTKPSLRGGTTRQSHKATVTQNRLPRRCAPHNDGVFIENSWDIILN